jgi:hypothetical protein
VGIGIEYDGAGVSYRVRQEIGKEDPANEFTSRRAHSICSVSFY